jgi:Cu+-exporting ATPase
VVSIPACHAGDPGSIPGPRVLLCSFSKPKIAFPNISTFAPLPTQMGEKRSVFSIEGMTCAACASSIETQLSKDPAILTVAVGLLAQRAEVTYVDRTPSEIVELIEQLGFDAKELQEARVQEIEVRIYGMTCASCSSSVEQQVGKMKGVVKVSVNLAFEKGSFVLLTVQPRYRMKQRQWDHEI